MVVELHSIVTKHHGSSLHRSLPRQDSLIPAHEKWTHKSDLVSRGRGRRSDVRALIQNDLPSGGLFDPHSRDKQAQSARRCATRGHDRNFGWPGNHRATAEEHNLAAVSFGKWKPSIVRWSGSLCTRPSSALRRCRERRWRRQTSAPKLSRHRLRCWHPQTASAGRASALRSASVSWRRRSCALESRTLPATNNKTTVIAATPIDVRRLFIVFPPQPAGDSISASNPAATPAIIAETHAANERSAASSMQTRPPSATPCVSSRALRQDEHATGERASTHILNSGR